MAITRVSALLDVTIALQRLFILPREQSVKALDSLAQSMCGRHAATVPFAADCALRIHQARWQLEACQWWNSASILAGECERLLKLASTRAPTSPPAVAVSAAEAREIARRRWAELALSEIHTTCGTNQESLIRGIDPERWHAFAMHSSRERAPSDAQWIAVSRRDGSVRFITSSIPDDPNED